MEEPMTTLLHRRHTAEQLNELIESAPEGLIALNDDHRRSLSARFRGVASNEHRRVDAWSVERAGQPSTPFRWGPTTARRTIGNAAFRRVASKPELWISDAVHHEIDDLLLRALSGSARAGSLGSWLSSLSHPALGLVSAEAMNWATQLTEAAQGLDYPWLIPASDAYYDVATARTTLRGRRDLIVERDESRIIIRLRAGAPGKSAGPGLRSDMTIDALAHVDGIAPARFIGLWPEAGVLLSVDGTMSDLRAGARDLVRTAVVQRRARLAIAA
jgi:hypothetical protein